MNELRYCLYLPGICMHDSLYLPIVQTVHTREKSKIRERANYIATTTHFRNTLLLTSSNHTTSKLASLLQTIEISRNNPLPAMPLLSYSAPPSPGLQGPDCHEIAKLICADKAFENTSTSVAASQMRNALNNLADTVSDPEEKKAGSPP